MTTWVMALVMPICIALGLGMGLAQLAITQQQIQTAADLAVIAALQEDCTSAARVAGAQGGIFGPVTLDACDIAEGGGRVEVSARMPELARRIGMILGDAEPVVRARAQASFATSAM
mgnify:CR=1 FL=1